MSGYRVAVFDCAGLYSESDAPDFAQCLSLVAAESQAHPRKVVEAYNLDRVDYDTNGLTEDERDAVDEVRS